MAAEDHFRTLIMTTLLSPSARRIDFTLGSIRIDGVGLAHVAGMLGSGAISLRIDTERSEITSYNTGGNYFTVPVTLRGRSTYERTQIVHEGCHALHDIYGGGNKDPQRGSRQTTRTENEAAAYVAGCLYYLYENGPRRTDTGILQQAFIIAASIFNRKGAVVPPDAAFLLRSLISVHPLYLYDLSELTKANG